MQRSYQSGAQKRKKEKEKTKQIEAVLSKVPKLTAFFKSSTSHDTSSSASEHTESSNVDFQSETEQLDHLNTSESLDQDDGSNTLHDLDLNEGEEVTAADSCTPEAATANDNCSCDPGKWGDFTDDDVKYWIHRGPSTCQNHSGPFEQSRRFYDAESRARFCSENTFYGKKANQERFKREWLIYSPTTGSVYCFVCKIFTSKDKQNKLTSDGFNDWKNVFQLHQHENGSLHRECMLTYIQRRKNCSDVSDNLQLEYQKEKNYWKEVLRRLIPVIITLAERGLPFRGTNEHFGVPDNGNYLGLLELIAQFDPFLKSHIENFADRGKGNPSYLSKTICEELINIMGSKVRYQIIQEVVAARYFSLSVDSTPDISHVDQLSVVVRYVAKNGKPVERFLTFLNFDGHKGVAMAELVLEFLATCGLDFKYCRGQSYDNAPNMSGIYSGMQTILLNLNEFAIYIPCAAHSLNLVGETAVKCCLFAVDFFSIVQLLYTFFSSSTHRWHVLKKHINNEKVLKSLSETRWEAHAKATEAIIKSFIEIVAALYEIADDLSQKSDCRHEAECIANKVQTLEFAFMLVLWSEILNSFRATSKTLQSEQTDLETCALMYSSLEDFIDGMRDKFEGFEDKARSILPDTNYANVARRVRRRTRQPNDGDAEEVALSPRDNFRVNGFLVIIDTLKTEINRRSKVYLEVSKRFSFLADFSLTENEYREKIADLVNFYHDDLEDFYLELIQFQAFIKLKFPSKLKFNHSDLYDSLIQDNLATVFPNIEIALRIFLTLMITNCSTERSFSKLKRIKNEQRSVMRQERLDMLSLMSIESDILRKIDFEDIINDFSELKCRKKVF